MSLTEADVREAISALRRQREIYVQMTEVGKRQSELVRRRDADELLALAARKQALLKAASELDRKTEDLRRTWLEIRSEVPPGLREEIDGAAAAVETALRELIAVEEEATREVESLRNDSAEQSTQRRTVRRALDAYGKGSQDPPPRTERTE